MKKTTPITKTVKAMLSLFTLIITFGLFLGFSTKVSAETAITAFSVFDITLPVEGNNPDFSVSLPSNAHYHIATATDLRNAGWIQADIAEYQSGMLWKNATDSHSTMGKSDTFEANNEYYVKVVLAPDENYKIEASGNYIINGSMDNVGPCSYYQGILTINSVTWTPTPLKSIESVNVYGIDFPEVGNTPDFAVTLPAGANYHLASVEEMKKIGWSNYYTDGYQNGVIWVNLSDGSKRLGTSDKFLPKNEYFMRVALLPNTGYKFSDSGDYTINGSEKYVSYHFDSDGIYLVDSIVWTLPESIESAEVSGITLPKTGLRPGYNVSLADTTQYHLATSDDLYIKGWKAEEVSRFTDGVNWSRQIGTSSHYEDLSSSDRFKAGERYTCSIALIPNDNYKFTKETVTKLNGSKDKVFSASINKRVLVIQSTVLKSEEKITSIAINNIPTPIAGSSCLLPSQKITLSSDPASTAEIYNIAWRDKTDGHTVKDTETFIEGHEYYLTVEVTIINPDKYIFEVDTSSTATSKPYTGTVLINGEAAARATAKAIVQTESEGRHLYISGKTIVAKTMPVSGITVSPTTKTLTGVGETFTIKPTVAPDTASNKKVTFSSSNEAVATVDANTGEVTAVTNGSATITAKTADGGKTATCAVTVKVPAPTLTAKGTVPLQIKKSTSAIKVVSCGVGDSVKSWSSSKKTIATVSKKGKITAKKKTGTTVITVTMKSGAKAKVTIKVQKGAVVPAKVKVNKKSVTLKVGKTFEVAASVTPITANQTVSYSTASKRIAIVSSKGVITARRKGTTRITVKAGKVRTTISVKVVK